MRYPISAVLLLFLANTAFGADPAARAVDGYIGCLRDAFVARIVDGAEDKAAIEAEAFADCTAARRLVMSTVPSSHVDSVLARVDDFMRQSLHKRLEIAAAEVAPPESP